MESFLSLLAIAMTWALGLNFMSDIGVVRLAMALSSLGFVFEDDSDQASESYILTKPELELHEIGLINTLITSEKREEQTQFPDSHHDRSSFCHLP